VELNIGPNEALPFIGGRSFGGQKGKDYALNYFILVAIQLLRGAQLRSILRGSYYEKCLSTLFDKFK